MYELLEHLASSMIKLAIAGQYAHIMISHAILNTIKIKTGESSRVLSSRFLLITF